MVISKKNFETRSKNKECNFTATFLDSSHLLKEEDHIKLEISIDILNRI